MRTSAEARGRTLLGLSLAAHFFAGGLAVELGGGPLSRGPRHPGLASRAARGGEHGHAGAIIGLRQGLGVAALRGGGVRKGQDDKEEGPKEGEVQGGRRRGEPGLRAMIGPGTWVGALHAANKALICWCSLPENRHSVVVVSDVGFLGLLGGLALTIARAGERLASVQSLLLQVGLSHLVFECVYNGIAIPMIAARDEDMADGKNVTASATEAAEGIPSVNKASAAGATQIPPAQPHESEGVFKKAKKKFVPGSGGLRPDIWLHHAFAIACFAVVLTTGEFNEEAVMLTAVETTCALPVAFGQAIKSKQLKGNRSLALAGLMTLGFTLRVLLSAQLTVPRVCQLANEVRGFGAPVVAQSGEAYEGSMSEWKRAVLVVGSFGLTLLNTLWLGKISQGTVKVVMKRFRGSEDINGVENGPIRSSGGSSGAP